MGRDGKKTSSRRDATVYNFLLDGTGRCMYFFHNGTGRYFFFHDGKGMSFFFRRHGTVRIRIFRIFHCSGERNAITHCSRHQGGSATSYIYVV